MDWSSIGETLLGHGLPLLGGVLAGPAGAAGGKLIASALGLSPSAGADEVNEALKADPQAVVKLREMEINNRHELSTLQIQAEIKSITEANATMRAEVQSEDKFVRRARPFLIWVIGGSVGSEVIIAGAVAMLTPDRIADLSILFAAIATPQSIAAAVCGIYMKKRSDDKAVVAGVPPGGGMLGALVDKIRGEK